VYYRDVNRLSKPVKHLFKGVEEMMKKILVLAMAVMLIVTAVGCKKKTAEAPASDVKAALSIEPGAKIKLGLDNDLWGAAVVELWNKTYPEYAGIVEYTNFGSAGGVDQIGLLQGEAPDVSLVIDGEVLRQVQSLATLPAAIANVASRVAQEPFYSNINKSRALYVPVAYDGMTFAWNKTMVEALGVDTKDADGDGLPDAFDTWEEIFAWSASLKTRPQFKGKDVNIVFPMSLGNQWSYYSSFTSSGWQIFAEGDPLKPGFDKDSFKASLEFLQAASKANISVEANGAKTPGASMGWRWDDFLNAEISPFGLVGTWMDVNGAEAATTSDFKFSRMPTWKGNQLSPLVKTKGLVINGFTKFPLAAAELLKLMLTKEGMQAMIDNSSYIPALRKGAPTTPDYSKDVNKQEMSAGFAFNYPEPSMSLPNNPAQAAMNVYYNILIEQSYYGVWDGTRTPSDAQAEIVKNANAWIQENNK
jgi:arabinogalactan oligomer / maltooligosaccharide transport system substrate-binding protein